MSLIDTIKPQKFHTFFIFPFGFNQKYTMKDLKEKFVSKDKIWKIKEYDVKNGKDYNEYLFFYPYIRKILFQSEKLTNDELNRLTFKYKKLKDDNVFYQVINDFDEDENKHFNLALPIINIYLHFFEYETGMLSFEILQDSPEYTLREYLQFLDMGRRIYPPFIHPESEIKNNKISNAFNIADSLDAISLKQCASKIIIKNIIEEDFTKGMTFDSSNPNKHFVSRIITHFLFSEDFSFSEKDYWPIVDDRMYTHSYFDIYENDEDVNGNKMFLDQLKEYFKQDISQSNLTDAVNVWYQMIFVDGNFPSCANEPMLKNILNESTYKRWIDWESIYGYSRYSSVVVSNSKVAPFIQDHFATMYYQLALLLFFYRGTLLTFSERATEISKEIEKEKSIKELQKLHEDFLLFENKYWFKEVTAQDQGIELFDLWESKMRNQLLMHDIKQGINELYLYFDTKRKKKTEKIFLFLTIIGGFLLPLSIAIDIITFDGNIGFWSLKVIPMINQSIFIKISWFVCFFVCIFTIGFLIHYFFHSKFKTLWIKVKKWFK